MEYRFLHSSGIVSYAVLRPPSSNAPCKPDPKSKLPILLSLHGAGVKAENPQLKESYDQLPDLCAWLLFPSGVTTWSGDDWRALPYRWHLEITKANPTLDTWGFADVEAAIAAIPEWMNRVNWTRQGVALDRWVVSGHSNGGQGAWYALTHRQVKHFHYQSAFRLIVVETTKSLQQHRYRDTFPFPPTCRTICGTKPILGKPQ
jgi:hypothetical protein